MATLEPAFHTRQTRVSDPGPLAHLYDALPGTVPELVKVVQGLFLHIFWAERYGVVPTDAQKGHVQARLVSRILAVITEIDPRPLTQPRPLEKRFFGNCRDHSVLLASMLRHKGVPARARCGFGTYFMPDHYEDHWICEYWNGQRWVSVDAQLDALQQQRLSIDFDPLDMPPGRFVPASDAWRLCRSGVADPDKFGIFDMHGLWFIRGNLLRELAAFADAEMLPWDVWGLMRTDDAALTPADRDLLDTIAAGLPVDSREIHQIYASDARLHVPDEMVVAGI